MLKFARTDKVPKNFSLLEPTGGVRLLLPKSLVKLLRENGFSDEMLEARGILTHHQKSKKVNGRNFDERIIDQLGQYRFWNRTQFANRRLDFTIQRAKPTGKIRSERSQATRQ